MLLLPKEIWDEVAVQSLKQDVEDVFTRGKMGTRFDSLMVAHKYDEANRMWCLRQFTLLHLPSLIKKAHSMDLNKWWFVDFIENRRIKYKNPMANILCAELVNRLRLGTSRDWFHNMWDQVLDEWIVEQPKEENVYLRAESNRFLTVLENFCVKRPEYVNWVNPYSLWVSEKISIPRLSIDSLKVWFDQENFHSQMSDSLEGRYVIGLRKHFAFVPNKPIGMKKFDEFAVMMEMMDIFWGEDQKRSENNRLFEICPREYYDCNYDYDSDDEFGLWQLEPSMAWQWSGNDGFEFVQE